MNPDFWKGKRVLVTGHTGFKGTWLTLWLRRLGAKVIGYSLPPSTSPGMFEMLMGSDGIVSIQGDILDLDHLTSVLQEHRPTVAFHMAAQSLVRPSYQDPVKTYATNVMGTVHFLESIRRTDSLRAAIVVTSDKCYRNQEWIWGYRENEALGGFDPYSNSKACAELVTSAYRDSFFARGTASNSVVVATARAGNVVGGGDWAADRLVPDVIRAFAEGQPALIRYPKATRPWQFVLEPLHGYMVLMEKLCNNGGAFAEGWNFGPKDDGVKSVSCLVSRLAELWGDGATWQSINGSTPHEAGHLKLDCTKSRSKLGWDPKVDFETSLAWVTEWYKSYEAGRDIVLLTHQQIERYQDLISA